jgi:hypothetical protein
MQAAESSTQMSRELRKEQMDEMFRGHCKVPSVLYGADGRRIRTKSLIAARVS